VSQDTPQYSRSLVQTPRHLVFRAEERWNEHILATKQDLISMVHVMFPCGGLSFGPNLRLKRSRYYFYADAVRNIGAHAGALI
jgi:hypothetical protein